MKTQLKTLVPAIVMTATSMAQANVYVPNGYNRIDSANGVKLYTNSGKDVFIQVVDLKKASLYHIYRKKKEVFYRYPINYLLPKGYFSVTNGAFFNNEINPTKFSFPFTPGNDNWKDTNSTRTLCIKDKNYATIYRDGYAQISYKDDCKFSLTLLSPYLNKSKKFKVGRMYIGIPNTRPYTTAFNSRYVIFFIAKAKKQSEMENIANNWRVEKGNLIMGDGSASAQYYGKNFSLYGTSCPGFNCIKRNIPHGVVVKPH